MDLASLIAEVRESPDDDAPRRRAADWYEGQPGAANLARADFIRTQLARANLRFDDVRQSELQARELRLLKDFGAQWTGSHFLFRKCRFRRGFAEYVHLHLRHFLHHRRQILALEPVRDVRLTGFFRASEELAQQVARCAEWQFVDTLRIHHQGPHKAPRKPLIALLESPQWSRLKTLHCAGVQFDVDDRLRFERLPVLRQIHKLKLPWLETYPSHPGQWFDRGRDAAREWTEIRTFHAPAWLQLQFLRDCLSLPFWPRLNGLNLCLSANPGEMFPTLTEHLPASLQVLHLTANQSPIDLTHAKDFFLRLAQVPLRELHLGWLPLDADLWAQVLRSCRWELRSLSLDNCRITRTHAREFARWPGLGSIRELAITVDDKFSAESSRALFSSDHWDVLTHLNLYSTGIGDRGLAAAINAKACASLRTLDVCQIGMDESGLRKLFASPHVGNLVWMSVGEGGSRKIPAIEFRPELVHQLEQLPHLAATSFYFQQSNRAAAERLRASSSIRWNWLLFDDDCDITRLRELQSPETWPPVDVRSNSFGGFLEENGGAPV